MKTIKLLSLFAILLVGNSIFAQAPQAFKYQAIARDNAGVTLENQSVAFQISILQSSPSGTAVYTENHNVTTNGFGLVNLNIGSGSVVSGAFSSITWGSNPYFIQVKLDPTGGTGYQLMGTAQLLSVPYALYAETSGSGGGASALNDLTDVNAGSPSSNQVLTWSGSQWIASTPVDNNTTYNAGTGLTLSGTTFNAQTSTALWNANKLQGRNISTATPATNQVLGWNGSQWIPQTNVSSPWTTSGSNIYRNTGNIGIGNTSPAYKLDITHSSTGTADNISVFLDAEGFTDAGTNAFGIRSEFNGNGAANNYGVFSEMTGTSEATGSNYAGYFNVPTGTAEDLMGVRSQVGDGGTVRNYAYYGHSEGTTATFNIGGIFIADGTSANDNYAIYASGVNAGTGSAYAGYFDGDVTVTGTFSNPSDRRLKTNIIDAENTLSKIKLLSVKSYDYIQSDFMRLPSGKQMGFIAQDLENVYPELVNTQVHIKNGENHEGNESFEYKAINYIGLVPVLTKAIQEQQELIEKQEALIKELDARLKALESK